MSTSVYPATWNWFCEDCGVFVRGFDDELHAQHDADDHWCEESESTDE